MFRKIQKAAAVFAIMAVVMASVTASGANLNEVKRRSKKGRCFITV